MTHALLGRKISMTQLFAEDGRMIPVTVIQVGPCPVVQVRTKEKDGYVAIQIGYDELKKNVTKPMKGHFRKAKVPPQRHLREIRLNGKDAAPVEVGTELTAKIFQIGDIVDVIGTTKGKGFQGTVKRHHFSRGAESHGSMNVRQPGSIGQSSDPSRVFKGMRMGGHMGASQATVKNVEVVRIDTEANVIFVKGSIPGPNGGVVLVRDARTGSTKEQRERPLVPAE
ncbi:MAG: 50S ribosomal protein L3 [Planctomycetota bacterium]